MIEIEDLYILNKKIWKESVVPCDEVDKFIKHFKLLRKHQKYEKENTEQILRIRFEDTIYEYGKNHGKYKRIFRNKIIKA